MAHYAIINKKMLKKNKARQKKIICSNLEILFKISIYSCNSEITFFFKTVEQNKKFSIYKNETLSPYYLSQ